MDGHDYLERADYCRRQATAAMTADTRAHWLRVAEAWLQMATDHDRALQIAIAALAKAAL